MKNRKLELAILFTAVVLTAGSWACSSKSGMQGNAASSGQLATAGTVVSAPSHAQGQSLNAQPGLWKIEATSGYFRVPMNQCLTAQDMTDPQRVAKVFGHPFDPMSTHQPDPGYHTLAEQTQQTCEYSDMNTTANSLAFKYQCKGAFSSTEDGSLKFDSPTHYTGAFNFAGDEQMDVRPTWPTISTEGSRVGDCTNSTF
jgi:hypothetical protein